jgi:hypothetical protein
VTAWLIERLAPSGLIYLCHRVNDVAPLGWTSNYDLALQYPSEIDAKLAWSTYPEMASVTDVRITEHEWCGPKEAAP